MGRDASRSLVVAVVCVVAIGIAAVVPALGAGSRGGAPPAAAFSEADPDFSAGLGREEQRRERLRTPDAKAVRQRSRTRFRDSGPVAALDVGRQEFPDEFTSRVFRGGEPSPGLRTVRSLGRGAAVVEDGAGGRLLLASSLPLETKTASGGVQPVDLALTETADAFRPANPLVSVRVAKRSRGGVRFGEKDAFNVIPETEADVAASEASDRVFFANALTDSDVLVTPRPAGAEIGWQLRSADSPERLVLNLDIPAGAVLRRARTDKPIPGDPPRAIEIAKGDRGLGYIYPPNAYDADGSPVRSQATIDGHRIIVTVDHRDADARYPIFVDPEVGLPNGDWFWPGWGHAQTPSSASQGTNFFGVALDNCAYYCDGIYLSMPTHTTYAARGTGVLWYYQAPANTYIYRAAFANMAHSPLLNGYQYSLWYQGILAPAGTWEPNVNYLNQAGGVGPNPFGPYSGAASGVTHDFCALPRCNRTQGTEQNLAIFGLNAHNQFSTTAPFSTGTLKATLKMSHAGVYLGDRRPPAITSPKPADRDWTDDTNTTHTLGTTSASDLGLGVYGITLSGAKTGNTTRRPTCTGYLYDPAQACPATWSTPPMNYTLDEGVNTLSLQAHDIVDNNSTKQTWTQKIDRSAPVIDLIRGELFDTRTAVEGELAVDPLYDLHVEASDSRSGVAAVEVYVDNVSQRARGGYIANCASTCALDWTFESDDYPDGVHTVTVEVLDGVADQQGARVRHVASQSFSVEIDRPTPPSVVESEAPSAPSEVELAEYDSHTELAQITWEPGEDPDVGVDSAGAGVAEEQYRYRQGDGQ